MAVTSFVVASVAIATLACTVSAVEIPDFGPDFNPSQADNMNGAYPLAQTPNGNMKLFPKRYADYPGGVEYYEVYSPAITTLYSQVWWSPLEPSPFPQEMIDKYAGKDVAIVGWEIDQVRKTPNGDVSVPISASYNHHYDSQIFGAGANVKKIKFDGPNDPRAQDILKNSAHGMLPWEEYHYVAEPKPGYEGKQVKTFITSSNGGEYRKSYHGYAPGYAVVINSPQALQVSPMQIDTWNRAEMNISGPFPPKFVPGPLPRASEAPVNPEYSGLLECPMTTRITKALDGTYLIRNKDQCQEPILTFQECYQAAATSLNVDKKHTMVNSAGSDPSRPIGCSASVDSKDPTTIHVYFNKLTTSSTTCAAGTKTVAGTTSSYVNVSVSMDVTGSEGVTITMSGPSDVWFGAGFGAKAMLDAPWTIVVSGGTQSNVSEYKLANHQAGTMLKPSLKVVSNTVSGNGVRTVVMTRALTGAGTNYYTFNTSVNNIDIIDAVGSTPGYSYHKDKEPTSLVLLPVEGQSSGACVCPEAPKPFGQASGQLVYNKVANQSADVGAGAVGFKAGKCANAPYTDLIGNKNPTCDIRHYQGGQWACHHMWSLLDADQEIPWTDEPLVFYHKYRLWIQPYNASYHTPVHYGGDTQMLIGSPWEYDVPKCADGVAGCVMENGTWVHYVRGNTYGNEHIVSLNFHCHAPTCLSMEVYTCPQDIPLADCNNTVPGSKLMCREEPVYGGTENPDVNGTRFNEPGYIAIRDCLWGSPEFGLEAPLNLSKTPLHMIKRANATWAHYGEMAGGQPFAF